MSEDHAPESRLKLTELIKPAAYLNRSVGDRYLLSNATMEAKLITDQFWIGALNGHKPTSIHCRVTTVAGNSSESQYTAKYDSEGRLLEFASLTDSQTTQYKYSGQGTLTEVRRIVDPELERFSTQLFTYDTLGRLSSVKLNETLSIKADEETITTVHKFEYSGEEDLPAKNIMTHDTIEYAFERGKNNLIESESRRITHADETVRVISAKYLYDENGWLHYIDTTSEIESSNVVSTFRRDQIIYNESNRIAEYKQGDITFKYTYNEGLHLTDIRWLTEEQEAPRLVCSLSYD